MEKEISLKLLYTALSDELLASYQYWTALHSSRGEGKFDADPEFEAHSKEEWEHAEDIMERIKELGGAPIPDPKDWQTLANPWTPISSRDLVDQLQVLIDAETTAVEFYTKAIQEVKEVDQTTHKLFRYILAEEEEHLYDLKELYCSITGSTFEELEEAQNGTPVMASKEESEEEEEEYLPQTTEEFMDYMDKKFEEFMKVSKVAKEGKEEAEALLEYLSEWEDEHEEDVENNSEWFADAEVKLSQIVEEFEEDEE